MPVTIPVDLTATNAAIAVVDANVDAVLVDTGTTIPSAIATVDSNVDAILVDTTGLDTYLDNVRPVVAAGGSDVSFSTASEAWTSTGASIVIPTIAGETFTVVCYACNFEMLGATTNREVEVSLYGSALGDPSNPNSGGTVWSVVGFRPQMGGTIARSGFASGETVTLRMSVGGGASSSVGISGTVSFIVYQETAV
tara:strand:+ start:137 stop:724 length:588 start_codon:yes stop_codon:yes gene_type:complete